MAAFKKYGNFWIFKKKLFDPLSQNCSNSKYIQDDVEVDGDKIRKTRNS